GAAAPHHDELPRRGRGNHAGQGRQDAAGTRAGAAAGGLQVNAVLGGRGSCRAAPACGSAGASPSRRISRMPSMASQQVYFLKRLNDVDRFFGGRARLASTTVKLGNRLREDRIPYAVAGTLAAFAHGRAGTD